MRALCHTDTSSSSRPRLSLLAITVQGVYGSVFFRSTRDTRSYIRARLRDRRWLYQRLFIPTDREPNPENSIAGYYLYERNRDEGGERGMRVERSERSLRTTTMVVVSVPQVMVEATAPRCGYSRSRFASSRI